MRLTPLLRCLFYRHKISFLFFNFALTLLETYGTCYEAVQLGFRDPLERFADKRACVNIESSKSKCQVLPPNL